jgi:coenzyme F420-dependent glucose-6-phosphate dehydrogenase
MLVLGYKAATEQFGPNELLDYVIEAEHWGFDAISASDHFHPWRNDDVRCFFVWSWLGTLGARTRRVTFGTGVTAPILRYNPAVLAEASATLGAQFPTGRPPENGRTTPSAAGGSRRPSRSCGGCGLAST